MFRFTYRTASLVTLALLASCSSPTSGTFDPTPPPIGTTDADADAGTDGGRVVAADGGSDNGRGPKIVGGTCEYGEPNDTRAQATPYVLGDMVEGACRTVIGDQDWYSFTTPTGTAGYLQASLRNISLGNPKLAVVDESDTEVAAAILDTSALPSDRRDLFAALAPGRTYWLHVDRTQGEPFPGSNSYDLVATFVPVPDTYEPNDTKADAKPIVVGTPVKAHFFAAARGSSGPTDADLEDWYSVTLPAGSVTVSMADVPTNAPVILQVRVLASDGTTSLGTASNGTSGQPFSRAFNVPSAGTYYAVVARSVGAAYWNGTGTALPSQFTKAYTLKVEL